MKLNGTSRRCLFEFYIDKRLPLNLCFLRFMLMSKNNAIFIGYFLDGMTLEFDSHKNGSKLILKKTRPNSIQFSISTEALISIIKLLSPQQIKLFLRWSLTKNMTNWLNTLFPYLKNVNGLDLYDFSPASISFLKKISPQLKKLSCNIKALMMPDFPVMNLDELRILMAEDINSDKISSILRHNIKTLHFDPNNIPDLIDLKITDINFGQKSIERIKFTMYDLSEIKSLLPIAVNFHNHLPKLNSLELIIDMYDNFTDDEVTLEEQLVSILRDIISLKNQTASIQMNLTVELNYIASFWKNDYTLEWIQAVSQIDEFKHTKFIAKGSENEKSYNAKYFEKNECVSCSFHLNFSISLLNELEVDMSSYEPDSEVESQQFHWSDYDELDDY